MARSREHELADLALALEYELSRTREQLALAGKTIEMLTAELEKLVGENRKLKGE